MSIYTVVYKYSGKDYLLMKTTYAESEDDLKESMKLWGWCSATTNESGRGAEAMQIVQRKPDDSLDAEFEAGQIPFSTTPISRCVSIQLKNEYIGDGRFNPEIVSTLRELANFLELDDSSAKYTLLSKGGTQVNVRVHTEYAEGFLDSI